MRQIVRVVHFQYELEQLFFRILRRSEASCYWESSLRQFDKAIIPLNLKTCVAIDPRGDRAVAIDHLAQRIPTAVRTKIGAPFKLISFTGLSRKTERGIVERQ
jgi:hypothetical protein